MSEAKTRAAVPPPKKKGFLPDTKAAEAANNMKGEKLAPMTFNMPRDWHTEFKTTAVLNGMNMKELLVASFAAWKREQEKK
ncbi:hypothetical protein PXK56_18130 [Phaeobacter gallaeciensis]|uniref:hypothetical protein n=1 Tax=Phaeobacter gallaeciensis TaxID=60890 RepID=UPI00238014AE|nr:hypothetical protein [Phaeobacter gallaeciensis]MDE4297109.1 hypothetical protein [Phaeobacter gallaeciensis]